VSLSRDFCLHKNYLADTILGSRHSLSKQAYIALHLLTQPIEYTDWQQRSRLTETEQSQLLALLNNIGGLVIQSSKSYRAYQKRINIVVRQLWFGRLPASLSRRGPLGFQAIWGASWRASRGVFAGVLATLVLVFGSGIDGFSALTQLFLVGLSLVVISNFAHELAHAWVVRRAGAQGFVLQAGLKLGVVHTTLSSSAELLSIWLGPISGITVAIGLTVVLTGMFQNTDYIIIGSVVSLLHLLSFLPWYGDGLSLWRLVRATP